METIGNTGLAPKKKRKITNFEFSPRVRGAVNNLRRWSGGLSAVAVVSRAILEAENKAERAEVEGV